MKYPRQINLGETQEAALKKWIEAELTNHLAERVDLIERWKRYQADYIAEPQTEVANFPFLGASTIIVPLTAIALEAVHSRTMQTAFSQATKIFCEVKNPEQKDLESEIEVYLDDEIMRGMNFRKQVEPAILELQKLGTGVIETTWRHETRRGVRSSSKGESEFEVTVYNGPWNVSVPISTFLMPFDCLDPQTARWCGKVFWMNPSQIMAREADGYFRGGTYEALCPAYQNTSSNSIDSADDYKQKVEELTDTTPDWREDAQLYWVATKWNVKDPTDPYDDEPEFIDEKEIFFIYERVTQTICAMWYNWYNDLRRPFRSGVYFPLENRWYGLGIAKQTEQFQAEATAIHRQRLDNSAIANMRMFKVNRNSGIKDGEPIFPGKFWFLDEMSDIEPMEMGDVKASSYNDENQINVYAQQRNGVNDLTLGMPNAGTPGTATDSMARVQESARKFDYNYSNARELLSTVIEDNVCDIQQWGVNVERLKYSPRGADIEAFFKQPYEEFRRGYLLHVGLANQNKNKMKDRQDATQLVGMFQNYYTSMLQLLQQNPNVQPEVMAKMLGTVMDGANLAMRHILETFDIRNADRYLINPSNVTSPVGQAVGPANGAGGGINPQGSSPNPGGFESNLVVAPNASSIFPAIPGNLSGVG